MAFIDSILTLMLSDASLNALITGDIVYEHLKTNFDVTKTNLVFAFTKISDIQGLNCNAYSEYLLECQVVAPDLHDVIDIAYELNRYLTTYSDPSSNFVEITFKDEAVNINTEKNVYYKNHNFDVIYVE